MLSYRLEVGPSDEDAVHSRFMIALNMLKKFFSGIDFKSLFQPRFMSCIVRVNR